MSIVPPADGAEEFRGKYGGSVRVRSDIWYSERCVEILGVGENGPRGGRPKIVQILLTPSQAADLARAVMSAADDPEAAS